MRVLAIESSCDETAVAIVEDGRLISNVVSSQIEIHRKYGGVVPEIAARKHLENILPLLDEALGEAGLTVQDIDVFGATYGPGLVGALLVGLSVAKGLALSLEKPFVGVNHLFGHLYANFLAYPDLKLPVTVLLVSGGHTEIFVMKDWNAVERVGKTRVEAAGEAFDKVARLLNLGYPGGPEIEAAAKNGSVIYEFPRAFMEKDNFDFSFSGLKTSVLYFLKKNPEALPADVAASFQEAVVDVLVRKSFAAAEKFDTGKVVFAGGVAANSRLRQEAELYARKTGIKVYFPPVALCTDNAAMIAMAAYEKAKRGIYSPLSTNAVPYLTLSDI